MEVASNVFKRARAMDGAHADYVCMEGGGGVAEKRI